MLKGTDSRNRSGRKPGLKGSRRLSAPFGRYGPATPKCNINRPESAGRKARRPRVDFPRGWPSSALHPFWEGSGVTPAQKGRTVGEKRTAGGGCATPTLRREHGFPTVWERFPGGTSKPTQRSGTFGPTDEQRSRAPCEKRFGRRTTRTYRVLEHQN